MPKTLNGFNQNAAAAIKSAVVAGADVDTNMAITGLALDDKLLSVIAIDGDGVLGVSVLDVTSEAAITSAGNIQVTTTDLTAYRVLAFYVDESVLAAGVAE